jgi:sugar phosphate isomerase/epimerase
MPDVSASRFRPFMNLQAFDTMQTRPSAGLESLPEAGYEGVQFSLPMDRPRKDEALRLGLGICGSGRVNSPADAEMLAKEAHGEGLECLTLHVGWGTESDGEAAKLIASVLEAAAKHSVPLYPETHRATIFQDPWRTVQFLKRFPELEFNADFSHWYTGTEMVYGGVEMKMEFIRPVLERIGFMHGRIGNPGCMQVDIGDGSEEKRPFVGHFRALWTASFAGFLKRRPAADRFCFAPELLGPQHYYARTFSSREESDRWEQSLVLVRMARKCFSDAEKCLGNP